MDRRHASPIAGAMLEIVNALAASWLSKWWQHVGDQQKQL
jgi:hypothetical protein